MCKWLSVLLVITSLTAYGGDEALSIDRGLSTDVQFSFENDDNIVPELSDFDVTHVVLMSNDSGERYAVITVKNSANGQRTLTQKQLMALKADGERINPKVFSRLFSPLQTQSLTLDFGRHKFPLLNVYSRAQ